MTDHIHNDRYLKVIFDEHLSNLKIKLDRVVNKQIVEITSDPMYHRVNQKYFGHFKKKGNVVIQDMKTKSNEAISHLDGKGDDKIKQIEQKSEDTMKELNDRLLEVRKYQNQVSTYTNRIESLETKNTILSATLFTGIALAIGASYFGVTNPSSPQSIVEH